MVTGGGGASAASPLGSSVALRAPPVTSGTSDTAFGAASVPDGNRTRPPQPAPSPSQGAAAGAIGSHVEAPNGAMAGSNQQRVVSSAISQQSGMDAVASSAFAQPTQQGGPATEAVGGHPSASLPRRVGSLSNWIGDHPAADSVTGTAVPQAPERTGAVIAPPSTAPDGQPPAL